MKKLRICTVLLLLMLLCGCTAKSPAFPDSRASEEIFSSAGSEESTVDERKAETAAEGSTVNTTEQAASESVSSDSTPVSSDNEKQTERRTPPAETKAKPETPKATQPTASEEQKAPTTPPATEEPAPSVTEPPTAQPTQPTEPPTEPAFDIGYFVSFAKSYAESVGLTLDSGAVYCWDNPIAAGPKCKYTERDIKGYLDRYAKDGDITDVWIWYEQARSGSYEIYIGYA